MKCLTIGSILLLSTILTSSLQESNPPLLRYPMTIIEDTHAYKKPSFLQHLLGEEDPIFRFYVSEPNLQSPFLIELEVGPAKQKINFMLDTASSISWINKSDCLGPLKSICDNAAKTAEITHNYAFGKIAGNIIETSITIDGEKSINHKMLAVSKKSDYMEYRMLGLNGTTDPVLKGFMKVLTLNKIIHEEAFSIYRDPKTVSIPIP